MHTKVQEVDIFESCILVEDRTRLEISKFSKFIFVYFLTCKRIIYGYVMSCELEFNS